MQMCYWGYEKNFQHHLQEWWSNHNELLWGNWEILRFPVVSPSCHAWLISNTTHSTHHISSCILGGNDNVFIITTRLMVKRCCWSLSPLEVTRCLSFEIFSTVINSVILTSIKARTINKSLLRIYLITLTRACLNISERDQVPRGE